jgi:hypothetical protein
MSENIAVVDQGFDTRAALPVAHQERGAARAERDRLAEALDRSRAELQQILDAQRDRDAAREADVARFVEARTAALLDGESAGDVAELPQPAAEAELSHEIATARLVEEQLAGKLGNAEGKVRHAEGKVRDAAAVLLVEHGERLAGELEVAEAEARAQRASLASLAGVWTPGARRGPLQIVVVATLLFAALHYIPPAHGAEPAGAGMLGFAEPFDWDRYHARQDACLEKDRIIADCVQGYCDELALRQAQRICSPFSGARERTR